MVDKRYQGTPEYKQMTARMWIAGIGAGLMSLLAQAAEPQPSPKLEPAQVVQMQLEALRRGTSADIATAFRFASPGNQSRTGPVARFEKMVRQGYPELIGYREVKLAPTVIEGEQAVQGVELIARDGRRYQFLFVLTQQLQAPCVACWMTDSVLGKPSNPDEQGT